MRLDGSATANRLKNAGGREKPNRPVKLDTVRDAEGRVLLSGTFDVRAG